MTKIALAKRVSFTSKSILSCILQVSKTNVANVQATRQVIPHGPLEPGERSKVEVVWRSREPEVKLNGP